jgi:hypothetical protein
MLAEFTRSAFCALCDREQTSLAAECAYRTLSWGFRACGTERTFRTQVLVSYDGASSASSYLSLVCCVAEESWSIEIVSWNCVGFICAIETLLAKQSLRIRY